MANKHTLSLGEKYAGVDATYNRAQRLVTLSGWYDTYAGIAPQTVTLTHFLHALGITAADAIEALQGVRRGLPCAHCGDLGWTYCDGEAGICIDDQACRARVAERDALGEVTAD